MFINSNNSRRMHGLPLHRKKNKKKRFYTRCEASEAVEYLLDYLDGYAYVISRRKKEGDAN